MADLVKKRLATSNSGVMLVASNSDIMFCSAVVMGILCCDGVSMPRKRTFQKYQKKGV